MASNPHKMALLSCLALDLLGAAAEQQDSLEGVLELVRAVVAKKNELLCDPEEREREYQDASRIFTLAFDDEAQKIIDRRSN